MLNLKWPFRDNSEKNIIQSMYIDLATLANLTNLTNHFYSLMIIIIVGAILPTVTQQDHRIELKLLIS